MFTAQYETRPDVFMNTPAQAHDHDHDHNLNETPPSVSVSSAGLWAVFWRMLLIGPFVAALGMFELIAVIVLTTLPFTVIGLLCTAHYVLAVWMMNVWIVWLKFGGPLRRRVFEGFEHGSL